MAIRKKHNVWMGDATACETMRKQVNDYKASASDDKSPWKFVTRQPGLVVWRVNKKMLEIVPKEEVGTFYNGDTYLVLHTHGDPLNEMKFDIYMWIGSQSTCDEYGFAAFKMTELDQRVLADAAVQHRETQNYESDEFQALFPSIKILKGGYESSMKITKEPERKPRLFHISGVRKNVKCAEISYRFENLNSEDVFIIDDGVSFYQFNGKTANKDERLKAAQALEGLKSRRKGAKVEIIEESVEGKNHPAIQALPKKASATLKKREVNKKVTFVLLRVSDQSGSIKVEKVKDTKASKKDFDPNDVFFYDTVEVCFVWYGSKISFVEKVMAVPLAEVYLHNTSQKGKSLKIISEGQESSDFLRMLA